MNSGADEKGCPGNVHVSPPSASTRNTRSSSSVHVNASSSCVTSVQDKSKKKPRPARKSAKDKEEGLDVKVDDVDVVDVADDEAVKFCPCYKAYGKSSSNMEGAAEIQCSQCEIWWHCDCAGLEKLSSEAASEIVNYKGPCCFVLPECIKTMLKLDIEVVEDGHEKGKAVTLKEMREELNVLHDKIRADLLAAPQSTAPPQVARSTPSLPSTQEECCNPSSPANPTQHIESVTENFVTIDSAPKLIKVLEGLKYTKVGTWDTVNLGAFYPYPGCPPQDPKTPTPCELQDVMDKANSDVCNEFKVNQITVNRYKGKGVLSEHPDNEGCIKVGSLILGVTLGEGKVLTFKDRLSNKEIDVSPPNRSLYTMSQRSQSLWTHRMDRLKQETQGEDYQYTITMRCVSDQNKNECIVLGDSNTDHFKFGEEKGTFGWLLPGKRVPTMRIKLIEPEECIGYPNVNVHVGINDIRECAPPKFRAKTDAPPRDIDTHVKNLVKKVSEIKRLSPGSRITVSSLLPTKLPALNHRCGLFNIQLIEQLRQTLPSVKVLTFLQLYNPETRKLHEPYAALRPDDNVHLSRRGRPILAKAIKEGILGSNIDSRSYSSAVGSRNVSTRRYPVRTW